MEGRRRTTEAQHACVTLRFGAILEHCSLGHANGNMTWAGLLRRARHILRAPPLEPSMACRAHCPRCLCGLASQISTLFLYGLAGMAGMVGEGRGEGVFDSLSTVSVWEELPRQRRSLADVRFTSISISSHLDAHFEHATRNQRPTQGTSDRRRPNLTRHLDTCCAGTPVSTSKAQSRDPFPVRGRLGVQKRIRNPTAVFPSGSTASSFLPY
jgi:hypothetical protein